MKHSEVIDLINSNHGCYWQGRKIEDENTRDKILFGNVEDECTGVAACIYPSIDVILKAIKARTNLIISHECLFWNHGDHIEWLKDNRTYEEKIRLLEENHITVYRDHDHIHAGVLLDGELEDGIFHGLLKELNLTGYVIGKAGIPTYLEIPEMPAREFVKILKDKMHLSMIKTIGQTEGTVKRIMIANHILGRDNEMILESEKRNIDTILAMEMVDFTTAIYVNDSSLLKRDKRILAIGHFNMEEPGMKWFGEEYLPSILPSNIPVVFIKTENLYKYM